MSPRSRRALAWLLIAAACRPSWVFAGSIDTSWLERPWPRERVRELEAGRAAVRWRQAVSRQEGLFAGVRFTAPLGQRQVWELANDYRALGRMTPGVAAVRCLERSDTRQVIQVEVKVLWKLLRLQFEIEQEPPTAVRFRLLNKRLGEYHGRCRFTPLRPSPGAEGAPSEQTTVELSTWLKPARPVPLSLLLMAERMVLLRGAEAFLRACEQ